MIFFTDENISTNAAHMLDIFDRENQIRACLDYFRAGISDTEWMRGIASWNELCSVIALCGDGRIIKNEVEKQVLKECGLTFVLLAPGWLHLQWDTYAWKIIRIWPEIVKNIKEARYPMLFDVPVNNLKIRAIGRINTL